jgi:hypothetical protein
MLHVNTFIEAKELEPRDKYLRLETILLTSRNITRGLSAPGHSFAYNFEDISDMKTGE